MASASTPEAALAAWPEADGLPLRRVPQGLINRSWAVGAPPRFALQLVHPQFGDAENARIEQAGELLARAGVGAPRLLRTAAGALSLPGPDGRRWRLAGWLPGESFDRVPSPAHARSAGRLFARFHDALEGMPDLPQTAFHDTEARMADLRRAHGESRDDAMRALAEDILGAWDAWRREEPPPVAPRPGHGDGKISNFLFAGAEATAIIDLDTLALFRIDDELGDALRSWCNPAGEDGEVRLDETIFAATVGGYVGAATRLAPEERARIVHGFGRIALELASRFCADAHDDRYWAWDPAVAPSRKAHNMMRGRRQLELARLVMARRGRLEDIVRTSA